LYIIEERKIYALIGLMQIIFYLSAFLGHILKNTGHRNKLLYVPCYFLFMNLNVFDGISYLSTHKTSGVWEKARRG
jgi:hypothetical protein